MITDLHIALHASGRNYQPSNLGPVFTNANDPHQIATFGIHKGRPRGFGYSALVAPASVPLEDKILHLCRAAYPLVPKIKEAGASEIYVKANFVCTDSCDVFLEAEELRLLASLGCDFSASCEVIASGEGANQSPQHNAGSGPVISDEAPPPHLPSSSERTARPQPPRG